MLRDPGLIPLSQQHHNGLALCVLTRRSMAADASPANLAKLAQRIVDRYELELTNHFEMEEHILFPAVEKELGPQPLVATLLAEHRNIEQAVSELRAAATTVQIERFCQLLTVHIRREEHEFFQHIQQFLSKEVLERVGQLLDAKAVRICL